MDILLNTWEFEYALVPCIIAYLIFDLPIIYRRVTRKAYVPIYFAFFPYGFSDELYAKYFDEDRFYMVGGPYRAVDKSKARTSIIWVSVLSLVLTMAISPFISGMFGHYILSSEQFTQFLWTLGIIKAVLLGTSLYNLRWEYQITDYVPISYIALIYIIYWGALLTLTINSYGWIAEQDSIGGFSSVMLSLWEFFLYDIGIQLALVAALGALIPWRLTQNFHPMDNEDEIE
ncbi:hypothetical protein [uncultured Sulfitobacter sp.]|uniref:hypothetical protein n=1 Tax=uncultured Sulfitobacter sp. TaxID=191468 RepID=UPI0026084B9B|nr:hypothetical protein [uncultured Sulfitobacter sp.]